jgi:protein SCO1
MATRELRETTQLMRRMSLSLAFAAALIVPVADADNVGSRDAIRRQHFPDVVLTTQTGKQVRFYEDLLKGKIVTINFMYTQCTEGVCPLTTYNLAQARRIIESRVGRNRLGRDIYMLSITLDPEHDTPGVLKSYAEQFHAGPGWFFLTGKADDIELLRRKLGFVDLDPELDRNKTSHIGNVRYGNEPLQQWSVVPGMAKPEVIATSILYADWPKVSAERQGRAEQ